MPDDPSVPFTLLSITFHPDGDEIRVAAAGEIDFTTAERFRTGLYTAINRNYPRILVDMGGVLFMDSSGISILIHAQRRAQAAGATLTVINCQPPIRQVLEVTGVYPS